MTVYLKRGEPTGEPIRCGALVIERDDYGNHRVCWDAGGLRVEGPWTAYIGIARVTIHGVTFRACTEYYRGVLPVERVFTVMEVE